MTFFYKDKSFYFMSFNKKKDLISLDKKRFNVVRIWPRRDGVASVGRRRRGRRLEWRPRPP